MGLFLFIVVIKKEKKQYKQSKLEQSYTVLKEQKREILHLKWELFLCRLFHRKEKVRRWH